MRQDAPYIPGLPYQGDWTMRECTGMGMATGPDGTVYIYEGTSSGALKARIAAYKDNQEVWTRELAACPSSPDVESRHYYPALGANGVLYVMNASNSCGLASQNKLYALDAQTGIDKVGFTPIDLPALPTNTPFLDTQIVIPYSNGVGVITAKDLIVYDLNGNKKQHTQRQLVLDDEQTIVQAAADAEGRLYVYMTPDTRPSTDTNNPPATCTGEGELAVLDTDLVLKRIPLNDCGFKVGHIAAAPDGTILIMGGAGSSWNAYDDRLLKVEIDGTVLYDIDLNAFPTGYNYMPQLDISGPHQKRPIIDDEGNAYVFSMVRKTGGSDRHIVVSAIDGDGNRTMLYSTEAIENSSITEYFASSAGVDISEGELGIVVCPVYSGTSQCFEGAETQLVLVQDANIGKRYPRDSGLSATASPANTTDYDEDLLTVAQENIMGTSDDKADTDGDGINDYKESTYYSARAATFCNNLTPQSCAYPDPLSKDIYVEVDWMDAGTYLTQPTPNQLVPVADAFAEQGIAVHFDIGAYAGTEDELVDGHGIGNYGGGGMVSYTQDIINMMSRDEDELDLLKYKDGSTYFGITPSFHKDSRYGIWRYMLVADAIPENYYGMNVVGDDDILLSYSNINAEAEDQAIFSGLVGKVVMHELGHSLCLTSPIGNYYLAYNIQSWRCIFNKVDAMPGSISAGNYLSLMHYSVLNNSTYTLNTVNYSDGLNGLGDHDDWSAVMMGIDDFSAENKNYTYISPPTTCYVECN